MYKNMRLLKLAALTSLCIVLIPLQAIADKVNSNKSKRSHSIEFPIAELYLEQNFTDGDTEVVMVAKGEDSGLRRFWLVGPKYNVVYRFNSPGRRRNLGGREILIESPEPADLNIILGAYPQGTYYFFGVDYEGQRFFSEVEFVHELPAPALITFPVEDSSVSRLALNVTWEAVDEAEFYIVELKNENTDATLEVIVTGTDNQFMAPEEWIVPDTEYQVGIFSVDQLGNRTSSELNFFTAAD